MIKYTSMLNEVIDISRWQQLQDSLAPVTKMALITIDYTGTPVTEHSSCSDFCQHVRNDDRLKELCFKCDSRGGLEAVRANEPYIYFCHFGIVDIAIPIIVDDKYIGAVMAGQVRLENPSSQNALEQLLTPSDQSFLHNILTTYQSDYEKLPTLSMSRIRTISAMLYHLCNYIVEEAIDKNLKLKSYLSLIYKNSPNDLGYDHLGLEVEHIDRIKSEMSNSMLNSLINEPSIHKKEYSLPLLQPAFDYIYTHKSERITLQKMSELCHISPSYFSRIFTKEFGVNFNAYLSELKLLWAKELLETTRLSVQQISDNLGFNDSGYLIKKFKTVYGVTPHVYRSHFINH